jgi:translation initiation factor IF-3
MGRGKGHRSKKPGSYRTTIRTRTNWEIKVPNVRLVGFKDTSSQIIPTRKALELAQEEGLDLVEIGPDQNPPICKIIDFGKYKFQQEKKSKDSKKHQHIIQVKEIKIRPKIDVNDYNIKLRKTIEFLQKGDKVKVSLRFRGREMAHPELGMKIIERMRDDTTEYSRIDSPPKHEGRQIVMLLAPKAGVARMKKGDASKKTKSRKKDDSQKAKGSRDSGKSKQGPKPEKSKNGN